MNRIVVGVFLMVSLALPAQAQAPVVLIARQLVKGIVQTFVQDRLMGLLSTLGPCGTPLGPTGGLATLAGLLGGGGGGGGIPGLGAMPGMPDLSTLAGAGGMGSLPDIGSAGSVVGLAGGAGQIAGIQASMEKMQREQLAQLPPPEAGGETTGPDGVDPPAPADIAQLTQELQHAEPLSSAELDELGGLMERMAGAMPSKANPCKPGELTQVLRSAADLPMGGGMLRMMLQPMRDMETSVAEARDRFASMSATESAEYVALMADESRGWDAENRDAFIGMAKTNFLGMPEPMQTQLLARLKQKKK